jgi:cytidyltransferase-like protein
MKKVMVFGTFDIFHEGHVSFLKQAGEYGDCLVAVVARDETVLKVKKQETRNKEQARVKILQSSKLANEVILGSLKDKYAVIKKYKPDVICLGYDQKAFTKYLKNKLGEFKLDKTQIIRLKSYYPEKYKSSLMKRNNKKGFVGLLVELLIAVALIVAGFFMWQKMSTNNLQEATKKASEEAGVEVNTQDATPQGQVNAVRDMMNKIQDKKNSEIQNELNK